MPTTVAVFGDSLTARGRNDAGITLATNISGYSAWTEQFLGDAFVRPFLNFGVAGDTTTQAFARIGDVTTAAPDICFVLVGTNDVAPGGPAAPTIIANLRAIYTALKLAGVSVYAAPIPPRTGLDAEREAVRQEVNAWVRATGETYLIDRLVDFETVFGAGGVPRPGYSDDGVHPTTLGALHIGRALASALQPQFSPPPPLANGAAVLAPSGALLGAAGTKLNGALGDIADNWELRKSAAATGLVVAGEKEPSRSVIADRQVVTASGAAPTGSADAYATFILVTAPTGLSAGENVQAMMELSVRASENITQAGLRMQIDGSTNVAALAGERFTPTTEAPRVPWDATIATPIVTVPASPTTLKISFEARFAPDANVVMEAAFSSVRLVKHA